MKRELLIIILFLNVFFVEAQVVVTIDSCQKWAVNQSSANVQKELNQQQLKIKINDAASHLYPTLEINGFVSYQSDVPNLHDYIPTADNMSKDRYSVSLDLQQSIFEGFKSIYGRKYQRILNQTEIYKLDISINQIKEKVISIYLNLLILDKHIAILSNAKSNLDEQLSRMKALLKEGMVYGNMIAQLEVEEMKLDQQAEELAATKESLISSLSILTNKDLSKAIFQTPIDPDVTTDTQSDRIEFKLFENQIASLDYQRKLHFSSSLPRIAFFANGGYGRPNYDIFQNDFDWFYRVGIKFNIPVISWAKTSGVAKIVNLQKSIVTSQQLDFEKANRIEIQEKQNEIARLERLLVIDKQITARYVSITETCRIQLTNGTITVYDFINQQNDEIQSLTNQELHSIQLLRAKFELLSLTGRI
ncbi:MAG: TolC family protein [Bacteroidales bacterium]|jgi:outer membrane protein TolC|nr:TolC family protein [Bacteroidales bacterium]